MALPTLTADQIEDIYATTFNQKMPEIIDGVYGRNPTLGILREKGGIVLDGGRRIEQNFIYGKLNGGSYGRGDPLNTARVNTSTSPTSRRGLGAGNSGPATQGSRPNRRASSGPRACTRTRILEPHTRATLLRDERT